MSEIWLVVEIYPKAYISQRIGMILDFVKPTIESLEEEQIIETFHFLFEPGHLLFRVRTLNAARRQQAKSIVEKNLDSIEETIARVEFREDYTGEHDGYGTEGWQHVQKLLEYSSRISLLKRETMASQKQSNACHLDREFNEGKLLASSRCEPRVCGYSYEKENCRPTL